MIGQFLKIITYDEVVEILKRMDGVVPITPTDKELVQQVSIYQV
jgi:hypothetical protein